MDAPLHGGSNDTIDGLVHLRRPEIPMFLCDVVLSSGPPIRVCEMAMDAPLHGGSNDTIKLNYVTLFLKSPKK
jgi:hypothetical protein